MYAYIALYLLHLKVYFTIFMLFGHVGFIEGEGQHPHRASIPSLGIKARPSPGFSVRDSERVTHYMYATLYIVYHATY